jgi:hypothetical protein
LPDFGRNLTITYIEKNFPLTDENGNVLMSDKIGTDGLPLPQYYEFTVNIAVPSPIPALADRQAFIDNLKAQADTIAKAIAQARANDIVDKNKIANIVKTINDDTGTVFQGTYVIT